jgi:hypothetical protein
LIVAKTIKEAGPLVLSTVADLSGPAVAPIDLLARYRQGPHASCAAYATISLELNTALLEQPGPSCCPAHLSLDAEVSHGALCKALVHAEVDRDRFLDLNCEMITALGLPAVFTIDCTAAPRPRPRAPPAPGATCSTSEPERTTSPGGATRWWLPWERKLSTLSPGRPRRAIKSSLRRSWFPPRRSFIP